MRLIILGDGFAYTYAALSAARLRDHEEHISQAEVAKDLMAEKHPLLQFVTVAELGGAEALLCSPAADQITGTATYRRGRLDATVARRDRIGL